MKKILLPINLDRWRSPIASLLREVAVRSPEFAFYSFSSPETEEDAARSAELWAHDHLHAIGKGKMLTARYDIVHHASSTWENLAAAAIARVRGLGRPRHLFTANLEVTKANGQYREFCLALRMAHTVVAVSEAVRTHTESAFGRKVAEVIPNGFDPDFFDPDVEPPPGDAGYFLWVGVIETRKRPDVFLEVAKGLPDERFVMLGDASPEPEAKAVCDQLDALPNVDLRGAVDRPALRSALAGARAMLFPSMREGLALSMIEALAMGVPVVAQPRSSMPELVRDGENGYLVDAEDLDGWIAAVRTLSVGENMESLRSSAREGVRETCSWDAVAAAYQNVYRGL